MTSASRFARVALNRPMPPYTYAVPEFLAGKIAPGGLVKVPLGKKAEVGFVVEMTDHDEGLGKKVKAIADVASPEYAMTPELMALAQFVASYYFCSIGEALATVSVVGFRDVQTQRAATFRLRPDWEALARGLTMKQRAACEALAVMGFPAATRPALGESAGVSTAIIGKLGEAGLLEAADPDLPPPAPVETAADADLALLPDQRKALDAITGAIDAGEFAAFLLFGVTGSGKTEVYLQAMKRVLERGGTALCLVPEISLTPQTLARFEARFGPLGAEIGVFHSQQTRREKLVLYRRIQAGRVRIVIGARSAVFSPLPRLGLIVVDEEHDGSYKQGETPRYHARDIAVLRANRLKIPVVLGSATPSLESYHNAEMGKYRLLTLTERASGEALPPVRVVDMAEQVVAQGNMSLFSVELRAAIAERLKRGEQTLLFLNRRGFSNFLFCPSCKWVARCDDDDIAMTVHRHGGARNDENAELDLFVPDADVGGKAVLKCHFCGVKADAPKVCPECQYEELMSVGSGTQRVERELATLFPDARVLRLDQDTTRGRQAFIDAWEQMTRGDADIILGTQMIAKGLHLEKVTLVGVMLADVGLFQPDFRAEERTFSVLTQVAGRAGRSSAGQVILQTYLPRHHTIRFACNHDYTGYYRAAAPKRRQIGFPPFGKLIALTLSDPDRDKAWAAGKTLGNILYRLKYHTNARDVVINGPLVAPISRLAGRFRYRLMLRGESPSRVAGLLRSALADREYKLPATTRVAIDVDPMDLL
ncbi:MAG: primosomal protein N' [Sumerlaeia bacterium]